jgi:ferredoxin-NADP reductase/predicted pyridoxine 5'-phosphate oxidase superfamily flavin-nucleotide-binding protein
MSHRYADIAFTESVRQVQRERNSRAGYERMDSGEDYNYLLSVNEAEFIAARDSFYMASVSETGWPYVQHRGGPRGFVVVLDAATIGFADYSGNRQYISCGNFRGNDRVSLFFMDYPNRRRLKVLGRIEQVADQDWQLLARLEPKDYDATVERGFVIHIEAFDWNCPQHITPRYTEAEIETVIAPLLEENRRLKEMLTAQPRVQVVRAQSWGDGELSLRVTGIRQLTPRVRAYELRSADGSQLPAVTAGAHLALPVMLEDGSQTIRHYSICSNPARQDIYEVAVLCDEQGRGGSKAIHKLLQIGQVLNCDPPANHFPLHEGNEAALLIAGGIGITPIKSMAQALRQRGVDFNVHYAGRSRDEMPFLDRLEREFSENFFSYSALDGQRMNLTDILAGRNTDTEVYVCGPPRLISAVIDAASVAGFPDKKIHYEYFAVDSAAGTSFSVHLAREDRLVEVAAEQSILDAIIQAGIDVPFSCRTGQCKSCVATVLDGIPEHRDVCLDGHERQQKRLMCLCVSRSESPVLVLDI